MNKPEILSPAGDFNNAIHALKSGADAVYLGLEEFSARKRAKNFTLDELRRLKTYTHQMDKKIYVALNTLLKDDELQQLYPILKELEDIEVDAIIVQDLGLAYIIQKYTNLPLHASTQLAVHNSYGIETLLSMGFSRAVLSRELSLNEIKILKERYPEMELEVFIHGAMCYGFSGICMASSKLLNRSANRGECGQICRTWFNNNGKKEYLFSLNDLNLEEGVKELQKIGIESLKIEGRMKGPGYASTTAALYRAIIDGKPYRELLDASRTSFNRSGSDLYLQKSDSKNRINTRYPGHIGLKIGRITRIEKSHFFAEISGNISNRDGLLVLTNNQPASDIKLSVKILEKKGREFKLAGSLPANIHKELYKISQHDSHLKEEKSTSYKPWKTEKVLKVDINSDSITLHCDTGDFHYQIDIEEANKPSDLIKQFNKVFQSGGETKYKFPLEIVNNTTFNDVFIPSSQLKSIRNQFYIEYIESVKDEILPPLDKIKTKELSYIRNRGEIPFIDNFQKLDLQELSIIDDSYLLPLSPVVFQIEKYTNELEEFLTHNRKHSFIIGLNNISHVSILKKLTKRYPCYIDYALYTVNSYAKKILMERVEPIEWFTKWIEEDRTENYPPIFISRSCFVGQKSGCPKGCKKHYSYTISQNNRKQQVVVRDCITYTMLLP